MPSKPSDYAKDALVLLNLAEIYPKTTHIRALADQLMWELAPAKPSVVMACVLYLRILPDFGVRRTQKQLAEAVGCSEISIRVCIKKISKRVIGYEWRRKSGTG